MVRTIAFIALCRSLLIIFTDLDAKCTQYFYAPCFQETYWQAVTLAKDAAR